MSEIYLSDLSHSYEQTNPKTSQFIFLHGRQDGGIKMDIKILLLLFNITS